MNKKTFFLPLLSAALLWIPSQSFSADEQGDHQMWNDLQLNADQKSKLLTMHNEVKDLRKNQRDEINAVRQKIKEELSKSNSSKTILSGFVSDLGKLHEKQIQSHIDHMMQLKTILTPEQFQKVIDKEWNGSKMGMGRQGNHEGAGGCNPKDAKGCSHDCRAKASSATGM
jgi:Spy/CpxP family protein refolding chaperone